MLVYINSESKNEKYVEPVERVREK